MALQVASGSVEFVLTQKVDDLFGDVKRTVNILHYFSNVPGAPITAPMMTNLLLSLSGNLAAAWRAVMTVGNVTMASVTARWMEDTSTAPVLDANPMAYNGNVPGDFEAPESPAYLKLNTAFRGRNFRGAKHISPVPESHVTGMRLGVAGLAAFGAVAAALLVPLTDGVNPYRLFVWNASAFVAPVIPGPALVNGSAVTSIQVRKTLGSMKRREAESVY